MRVRIFIANFVAMVDSAIFGRTELLLGGRVMRAVESASVIVFGVGGVGSWCAEALVRSGIRRITIVDSDAVSASNINRQLMATTRTVGLPKVDVLRERMMEINPAAEVDARCEVYSELTAESFRLGEYDYVVDAIDSVANKMDLILRANDSGSTLFSSMGAALKMDSSRVSVAEFWKVKGCPLAASLRRRMKKSGRFPRRKFKCVYSDELLENEGNASDSDTLGELVLPSSDDWHGAKAHVNGALAHITGIFGLTLAGLVISDIRRKTLSAGLCAE